MSKGCEIVDKRTVSSNCPSTDGALTTLDGSKTFSVNMIFKSTWRSSIGVPTICPQFKRPSTCSCKRSKSGCFRKKNMNFSCAKIFLSVFDVTTLFQYGMNESSASRFVFIRRALELVSNQDIKRSRKLGRKWCSRSSTSRTVFSWKEGSFNRSENTGCGEISSWKCLVIQKESLKPWKALYLRSSEILSSSDLRNMSFLVLFRANIALEYQNCP